MLLGISKVTLAKLAGTKVSTILAFESGQRTSQPSTLEAVQRALEAAGIEFLNHGQPGVRLRKEAGT